MKHVIKSIDPTSPLRGRAEPGYELVSINGHAILDVLDYKFYAYDPRLKLELRTPRGETLRLKIKKPVGGDLGLDFETYLMDRPRHCANKCVFCFIDQMPPGMRPSLYFKDDDARLSFLMGNYITLTNLSDREVQRIIDLRISPINISVHTTDPELRVRMMGNPRAGERLGCLRRFAEAGITLNCQIVCCPGWNDGAALERSMTDLAALAPQMHSVSIVPVGLTKYREGLAELKPFTRSSAAQTVAQVTAFGDRCLAERGERIFFCSDELYIAAGLPLPPEEFYEDFAQLDNGVGMLRLQEAEFMAALRCADSASSAPFTIACGEIAAPFLQSLLDAAAEKFPQVRGSVRPIVNRFFGGGVTVSGLVTGGDLTAQLQGTDIGERVLITRNMLRRDELDFLDGVTLAEAAQALGVPVYPIEQDGGCLCDAVLGDLPEIPAPVRGEDTEYCRYN
ncbi:MAG: DUF512 domain-containing protein [Oscillospiraceae bacterium]|nr:DUF512 domain-containing protein [Oscillospiraceae bacterium]